MSKGVVPARRNISEDTDPGNFQLCPYKVFFWVALEVSNDTVQNKEKTLGDSAWSARTTPSAATGAA